jgi:hypothetical protein
VSAGEFTDAAEETGGALSTAMETALDKTSTAASDDRTPLSDTGKR